jgi:hypothetical protein
VFPSNEENQFIVSNKETGRDYLLVAETESEKESWLVAIEGVVPQDHKKVSFQILINTNTNT